MIDKADLKFLAEANAKQWLDAIVIQGERCAIALNALRNSGASEDFRHPSNMMRVEEHFFVIAIGKAMDWLSELAQLESGFQPAVEDYLSKLPHARDIRNMREHDIEYFKGRGKRQPNFIYHHTNTDGQVLAQADASSTIVFGQHHLIGGRLDLNCVVTASKELSLALANQ